MPLFIQASKQMGLPLYLISRLFHRDSMFESLMLVWSFLSSFSREIFVFLNIDLDLTSLVELVVKRVRGFSLSKMAFSISNHNGV